MSHILLVFEVMNAIGPYFIINLKFRSRQGIGHLVPHARVLFTISTIFHLLIFSKLILKQVYFSFITSKTSKLWLITPLPNLLERHFVVLQPWVHLSFFLGVSKASTRQQIKIMSSPVRSTAFHDHGIQWQTMICWKIYLR